MSASPSVTRSPLVTLSGRKASKATIATHLDALRSIVSEANASNATFAERMAVALFAAWSARALTPDVLAILDTWDVSTKERSYVRRVAANLLTYSRKTLSESDVRDALRIARGNGKALAVKTDAAKDLAKVVSKRGRGPAKTPGGTPASTTPASTTPASTTPASTPAASTTPASTTPVMPDASAIAAWVILNARTLAAHMTQAQANTVGAVLMQHAGVK